jgi:hypothetical protein
MKVDFQEIFDHIELQKNKLNGTSRKGWPNFIYHTTNLDNALRIVASQRILSRNMAINSQSLISDVADPDVISKTDSVWKDYARFYFRPKTPTMWVNEGIKPLAQRGKAHCPVPVCFLFNAKKMLVQDNCIFSNGNLGSQTVSTGTDAAFFKNLNFDKIFHDSPHNDKNITFSRCAEAIFPGSVDFTNLEFIVLRSEAEKETFINMIDYNFALTWKDKIRVSTRLPVFNENWNFVRDVKWSGKNIVVKFNEQRKNSRGPFNFEWEITQIWGGLGTSASKTHPDFEIPNDYEITLNSYADKSISFQMKLDNILIYNKNFHHASDNPF